MLSKRSSIVSCLTKSRWSTVCWVNSWVRQSELKKLCLKFNNFLNWRIKKCTVGGTAKFAPFVDIWLILHYVRSLQQDIIILAELSGMPKLVSCCLIQVIFSTLSSLLADVTHLEKREDEGDCERVGKHEEVVVREVRLGETKAVLASWELQACL